MSVTQDATSTIYIPQSAAEWATFNALNGWATPDHLYLFQEASGSIIDQIGSSNLTVAGAPSYRNAVSGWSTLALNFTDGTTGQRAKSTAIADISTTSVLILAYVLTPTTPGATRKFITAGTAATVASTDLTTTPRYRATDQANTLVGTGTVPTTTVSPIILKVDHTNSVVTGYMLVDKLTPVFEAGLSGNEICFGSADNGAIATIAMSLLYAAVWVGSNAEKLDADVKALMVGLGNGVWLPTWSAAYTVALSSTWAGWSDAVTAVYAANQALADTSSLTDALVSTAALSVGAADGLSESVPWSDVVVPGYAAIVSAADMVTMSDSANVVAGSSVPVTDMLPISDALHITADITAPQYPGDGTVAVSAYIGTVRG